MNPGRQQLPSLQRPAGLATGWNLRTLHARLELDQTTVASNPIFQSLPDWFPVVALGILLPGVLAAVSCYEKGTVEVLAGFQEDLSLVNLAAALTGLVNLDALGFHGRDAVNFGAVLALLCALSVAGFRWSSSVQKRVDDCRFWRRVHWYAERHLHLILLGSPKKPALPWTQIVAVFLGTSALIASTVAAFIYALGT